MSVELKPLSFRRFAKNASEMYDSLESNRERPAPWFWWANKFVTPDKMGFYLFWAACIMGTKCRKMLYKINFVESYNELFLVYCDGKIAGMYGLEDIDVKKKTNARIWACRLRINTPEMADSAIKQIEEHARELGLNSVYGDVLSTDKTYIALCVQNNFELKKVSYNTLTYEKYLGR